MPEVFIPTPLRKYTDQQKRFQAEAETVEEALNQLSSRYPDVKRHLYDEQGDLRSFIQIYVGDKEIKELEAEKTPVSRDTEIHIVPAIAGGRHGGLRCCCRIG